MNRSVAITILAVTLGVIVAGAAYQLGLGHGLATTGQPVVEGMRDHYGWGFGFFPLFGLLFPILFLFLLFGLFRAAFGGPRWGHGGGPWMDRRTMAEEWHRNMHERTERRTDSGSERGTSGPSA